MHPDWSALTASWGMALEADGYAAHTIRTYQRATGNLAGWLAEHHPDVGPLELERGQVRAWLAQTRRAHSQATARSWLSGIRHFCRWLVEEGETDLDPTVGIRTPPPTPPRTRVLAEADLRRLVKACEGRTFADRRDLAMVLLLLDCGLRLGELAGLQLQDVNLLGRVILVAGKGSRRSGPRHRAVPIGVRTARALDRYLRARRHHPYADRPALWLGDRGRPTIADDGIDLAIKRRARAAGLWGVHPHQLRHSWAHAFRAAGGAEGDLMVLGGWSDRSMLDRYGASTAAERAAEAGRRLSLADRL
jgi:site-specific recombinase XerC